MYQQAPILTRNVPVSYPRQPLKSHHQGIISCVMAGSAKSDPVTGVKSDLRLCSAPAQASHTGGRVSDNPTARYQYWPIRLSYTMSAGAAARAEISGAGFISTGLATFNLNLPECCENCATDQNMEDTDSGSVRISALEPEVQTTHKEGTQCL